MNELYTNGFELRLVCEFLPRAVRHVNRTMRRRLHIIQIDCVCVLCAACDTDKKSCSLCCVCDRVLFIIYIVHIAFHIILEQLTFICDAIYA